MTTLDTLIDYKQLVEALADKDMSLASSPGFATKLLDLPKTEIYVSGWPSSS